MQANSHMAQAKQEMALLYRKHAPGLLSYVRMRITSEEEAEDIWWWKFSWRPSRIQNLPR